MNHYAPNYFTSTKIQLCFLLLAYQGINFNSLFFPANFIKESNILFESFHPISKRDYSECFDSISKRDYPENLCCIVEANDTQRMSA